ncbi:aa3-type cytochrome c oxidase subunit IV [Sphingomonas sp. CFBP 8764]|nr:aa3-type cytochrome c oxidase subunit IV [Sphingomonas sp. CFBP 8764]MBD8551114.1 aa3-type cytochrome c oxidase subunit IV [Sphingomonas sp. CFBP 8764]
MADDANIKGHAATYDSVIGVMRIGAIACAVIVAIVIWLIS